MWLMQFSGSWHGEQSTEIFRLAVRGNLGVMLKTFQSPFTAQTLPKALNKPKEGYF